MISSLARRTEAPSIWRSWTSERNLRRLLIVVSLGGLVLGLLVWASGRADLAAWLWAGGTIPVIAGLLVSMIRDLLAGRLGVDAIAFISMSTAIALGENLAAAVVAVMYAGGNVLEDFAVARAEHDLRLLVDRAPRIAHRREGSTIADIAVEKVVVGDTILVRAGEVIPVDGIIIDQSATIDESALTGEPIPVTRKEGELARSGTVNAGETFEIRTTATAGESTYAGIVRMVTAAQTAKAPFIRLADRYALLLLPLSLAVAGCAWLLSGDATRGLAVLVVATPCPLILAAPVAFIAGVARAARLGILIKGGRPFEALARTRTVMFDKTGTLTIGGARLVAVEVAPGENADEVLRVAASLEQASHHIVAAAIVGAAQRRRLKLSIPSQVREAPGSGLEGIVDGQTVRAGSHQLIYGPRKTEDWALRALRRAAWRSALSVFVAVNGKTIGVLLLGDELRRETPHAIRALRAAGVSRIVMLTGDRADAAETIGAALDLDAVLADRVPADKVDAVAREQRLNPTVMVGDGINDAPALAAAAVGIAMGSKGASAASEAADVVVLVDRLDRVSDAISIAKRARGIALQSVVAGMALSVVAMAFAAFGLLSPVAGAFTQEAIDIAVILNALRALTPGYRFRRPAMTAATATGLRLDHERLKDKLNRLREIADALDDAVAEQAVSLICEANEIVAHYIVKHEREDETKTYPELAKHLSDGHGLDAMSRAHREILHLGRLLGYIAEGLTAKDADRYLVRDAQRAIESLEALVRIHNAQEEDIYEHAVLR
jgi:heavy metal translocating P-type ATPase